MGQYGLELSIVCISGELHTRGGTIYQAFARCSLEFFVCARRLDASEAQLADSIGLWSGIASDDELNAMWEQIKNDF